jgi:hypothetical protein
MTFVFRIYVDRWTVPEESPCKSIFGGNLRIADGVASGLWAILKLFGQDYT